MTRCPHCNSPSDTNYYAGAEWTCGSRKGFLSELCLRRQVERLRKAALVILKKTETER